MFNPHGDTLMGSHNIWPVIAEPLNDMMLPSKDDFCPGDGGSGIITPALA